MYYWNFLFLVLLCILNSIEADVRLVNGREYSCKRSLHFYPDTPSYNRRDVRFRKTSPEFLVRDEYQDLPILRQERDSRIQTRTITDRRNEQSRNVNSGLNRFQRNHDRFRQRQAENKQFSRLTRNRQLSAERLENLYKRRIVGNSHNLRTRSVTRKSESKNGNINTRAISSNRFDEVRGANIRAFRHPGLGKDSTRDTRLSINIENNRKINGLELRESLNRREMEILRQPIKDSDKQRERITPSVKTRQTERESLSRRDVRNHQLTKRSGSLNARQLIDSPTSIRRSIKNVAERREREVRNEQIDRRELRQRSISRMGDSSLRSSVRLSLAYIESRAILTMERDVTVRRDLNIQHNGRSVHFTVGQRSSDMSQRSFRSLEIRTVGDNRRSTNGVQNDHGATRAERTQSTQRSIQVRQRLINSIRDSLSRSDYETNSIDKVRHVNAIVNTGETRDNQRKERDVRLNKNKRLSNEGSSLREVERNVLRGTREVEKISNNVARNVERFSQQPSHLRHCSSNRPERSRSTERLKKSTAGANVSKRDNDRRISERRDQRTAYQESTRRSNFHIRLVRGSTTRDNRILHNMKRNVERMNFRKDNTMLSTKVGQVIVNKQNRRESRLIRSENVERNKIQREHHLHFERSRNILNDNLNEKLNHPLFNWQSAFYALQAIYICSIVFKALNKADVTKKKTWIYSWLAVPINKID